MPNVGDDASFARQYFLRYDQYEEKAETLEALLSIGNVISGHAQFVRSAGNALDEKFSVMLGEVRKDLAKAILNRNNIENTQALSYYVQTIINRILFIRVCEARDLEADKLLTARALNQPKALAIPIVGFCYYSNAIYLISIYLKYSTFPFGLKFVTVTLYPFRPHLKKRNLCLYTRFINNESESLTA